MASKKSSLNPDANTPPDSSSIFWVAPLSNSDHKNHHNHHNRFLGDTQPNLGEFISLSGSNASPNVRGWAFGMSNHRNETHSNTWIPWNHSQVRWARITKARAMDPMGMIPRLMGDWLFLTAQDRLERSAVNDLHLSRLTPFLLKLWNDGHECQGPLKSLG